jgi:phosphoesterase RecJ-like protein
MTQAYKTLSDLIRNSQSFIVTSHIDPDGDAIGCALAMFSVLKRLNKTVKVLSEDGVPPSYTFLEGASEVLTSRADPCDVAVVVDSGGLDRTGWVGEVVKQCRTVVNIDHHMSNTYFGDINIVDMSAGACGEIVYKVLDELGAGLVKSEAEALYVAILSDTGCFRFPSTTAGTLKIAAHLLDLGVRPYHAASEIYWKKSLASLKILGNTLSSIEVTDDGKIAMMQVTRDMYRAAGASAVDTEGLANYPRSINGVAVGVFLRETSEGCFRVSLRAAEGYDVDAVAKVFGGGGHAAAAGFRIEGDLESVKAKVRQSIYSHLKHRDLSANS